jgi:hypothetical protein
MTAETYWESLSHHEQKFLNKISCPHCSVKGIKSVKECNSLIKCSDEKIISRRKVALKYHKMNGEKFIYMPRKG